MKDDTREHQRPTEGVVAGPRVTLTPEKSLLLPVRNNTRLVIHFHGPGWIVEQAARDRYRGCGVLTVQANGASDAYRQIVATPGAFAALLAEAEGAAKTKFRTVVISSFSAGYGAVREILREKENWARIDGVILADSMHASYGEEQQDIGPFIEFAKEAATGRKQFVVTHSEVFPGTYASTSETSGYLLGQIGVKRKAVLEWGALGMQQVSRADLGGFHLLGFAGNSAPDHMDHLFAFEEWFGKLHLPKGRR